MRTLNRLFPMLVGAAGSTCACAVLAVGCSSNNGAGSSPDASTDGTVVDARSDATEDAPADHEADADAGAKAEGDAGDAGDGGFADAGDAQPDTGAEPDGSDAGSEGGTIDPAALAFPGQVATAICDRIAACCGTTADAGSFDWAKCYSTFLSQGIDISNSGTNLIDGGHVVYSATLGQACLADIAAIDCTAMTTMDNTIDQTAKAALFQSCYGALQGTLDAGALCNGPIECAPGQFCDPVDADVGDSGALGVCAPLRTEGQPCGDFGSNVDLSESACSYRASTSTGLFCEFAPGPSFNVLPTSMWTCQQAGDLDASCVRDEECVSKICDPIALTCISSTTFAAPSTCQLYVVDGGDGG